MYSTIGPCIVEFIENYIIYQFGIPTQIIIDNGKKFNNKYIKKLCEIYHIKKIFSTPYYPQGNGQAKATNKTLCSILIKIINEFHRDWHVQIPKASWEYRTSIRTPTGETPFSLVYKEEAILPIELEIPSLRVQLGDYISEEEARKTCLNALEHMRAYQDHIKHAYYKKVKIHEFKVEDLVLKQNQ